MDPLGWGGPVNAAPEIKVCSGRAAGYSIRGGSHTGEFFVFMPYVEAAEESLEASFQELEFVSNAYVESPPVQPRLFGVALMVARVMLKDKYEPGMGLGQNGDGTASLVEFPENRGRFGLGYKPSQVDKRRVSLERKERSLAHLQGRGLQVEGVPICHISKSFISVGWMRKDQVTVIEEETPQNRPNWVQPSPPSFELGNWKIVE